MNIAPVFHPGRSKYLVITTEYLLPCLIILGVIFLTYLTLYSPFFRISKVACTLDYQPCEDPVVLAELQKIHGQNIFRFDPAVLSARLTSGDFTIREARIVRTLPSLVQVTLQSVYPVVALQVTGQSSWIVLDQKLRVIGIHQTDPNVPTVIISTPLSLSVGQPPGDSTIVQVLQLAQHLASEIPTVKSLKLVDQNMVTLSLADARLVILNPQKDEAAQVKALQAVLSDATILKDIHTIDVRFARPVLR